MKDYELTHTNNGEHLYRLLDSGWDYLKDPLGGGHADSRATGGWWLYKGDEQLAQEEQARRWVEIKKSIDNYYSQPWV